MRTSQTIRLSVHTIEMEDERENVSNLRGDTQVLTDTINWHVLANLLQHEWPGLLQMKRKGVKFVQLVDSSRHSFPRNSLSSSRFVQSLVC